MKLTSLLRGEAIPIASGVARLSDGRNLAWTSWGAPDGTPILCQSHIGTTGQRDSVRYIQPLTDAGFRCIQVTRAGLHRSSPKRRRSVQTDASDMIELADQLGLGSVHVVGECGGAGAALAFAARQPDRVVGVALVSPIAPLRGPGSEVYLTRYWRAMRSLVKYAFIARWEFRLRARAFARDPDAYLDRGLAAQPEADRVLASEPVARALAKASLVAALAAPNGLIDEYRTFLRAWSIDFAAVRQPVFISHGALDQTAPPAMAEWFASQLPGAELSIDPERGHFATPEHLVEILRRITTS